MNSTRNTVRLQTLEDVYINQKTLDNGDILIFNKDGNRFNNSSLKNAIEKYVDLGDLLTINIDAGEIDLSNYVTNDSLSTTLSAYVTTSALNGILGSYVTLQQLNIELAKYVTLDTTQTITGTKTFSQDLTVTANIRATGNIIAYYTGTGSLSLPIATTSKLGTIIVGNGLSITPSGILSLAGGTGTINKIDTIGDGNVLTNAILSSDFETLTLTKTLNAITAENLNNYLLEKEYNIGAFWDYYWYVIGLVELDNTKPSYTSYCYGRLTLTRNNGNNSPINITFSGSKIYNSERMSASIIGANTSIRLCTFTYNNKKYGGVIVIINSQYNHVNKFIGQLSGLANPLVVPYWDSRGTVLNQEIYNSINYSFGNTTTITRNNTLIDSDVYIRNLYPVESLAGYGLGNVSNRWSVTYSQKVFTGVKSTESDGASGTIIDEAGRLHICGPSPVINFYRNTTSVTGQIHSSSNGNFLVNGNWSPLTNNVHGLGLATYRWKEAYIYSNIKVGVSKITVADGTTGGVYADGYIDLSHIEPFIRFRHNNTTGAGIYLQSIGSDVLSIYGHFYPRNNAVFALGRYDYKWSAGWFHAAVNVSTGNLTPGSGAIGVSLNGSGGIEISHATTPYIDFHYANSTIDYTSRLYEAYSGQLVVTGKLMVGGNVGSTSYTFYSYGTSHLNGNTIITGTLNVSQTIYATGNITSAANIIAYTASDKRLKKNIRDINASELLLSLGKIKQYDYTNKAKEINNNIKDNSIGLMYQNVVNILPSMAYKLEGGEYGCLNYLSSDYINIIAGATQENIENIEILKREIKELRIIICTLKQQLKLK